MRGVMVRASTMCVQLLSALSRIYVHPMLGLTASRGAVSLNNDAKCQTHKDHGWIFSMNVCTEQQ